MGRDDAPSGKNSSSGVFQSTLPVWGGTQSGVNDWFPSVFQSTLPVWGGTSRNPNSSLQYRFQSTLPVWGGTFQSLSCWPLVPYFNPPSPCGEGRKLIVKFRVLLRISIHPPRVGRDRRACALPSEMHISIHPPRVGRDRVHRVTKNNTGYFNPPSPCGEGRNLHLIIELLK